MADDSIGKMNGAHDADIAVFTEALRLPPEERDRYLSEACKGDVELRSRVEALLLAYGQAADFLGRPAAEMPRKAAPVLPAVEKPGDRIGHYKLLQQIGEGGGGVVYMAEQQAPVRRRVALKIIKPGMDTKSVIARFFSRGNHLSSFWWSLRNRFSKEIACLLVGLQQGLDSAAELRVSLASPVQITIALFRRKAESFREDRDILVRSTVHLPIEPLLG